MELKDYQSAALEAFVRWRDALDSAWAQSDTASAALEGTGVDVPEVRDYPRKAWEQLAQNGEVAESAGAYVSRSDDAGRPHPARLLQGAYRRRQDPAGGSRGWSG